jgi:hypothetical protein
VTERLCARREAEQAERAQSEAEQRAADAAYAEVAQRLDGLDAGERETAIAAYEHDHPAGDFHAEQLRARHEQLTHAEADTVVDEQEA